MTISVLQESWLGSTSGAVTSFAVTLGSNVTALSAFHVVVMIPSTNSLTGISDNQGDTFHSLGTLTDTTDSRFVQHWYANAVVGGSTTVTVTFSGTGSQWYILVREIGSCTGEDSSSTGPAQGGQIMASGSYTAGSNCWTTGSTNFVPSLQPGLVSGWMTNPVSGPPAVVGTGFTQGIGQTSIGGNMGGQFLSESKRYTSTSGFAVTFTDNGANTNSAMILGALFIESSGDTLMGQAVL